MTASTISGVREVLGTQTGGTGVSRGEELYRFVRENRPTSCLELGFAHGLGSTWVAAALEANGDGRLTSVDLPVARDREPSAESNLTRAGLTHRVDMVLDEGGYNWFLHDRLLEQRRDDGTVAPLYDFVFIDGAHTWEVDGLAFALVDRLLKPGGWILFDDLDWKLDAERFADVPERERQYAQVRQVWDLMVTTHPQYDLLQDDGEWGWARKSVTPNPTTRTVTKQDALGQARRIARMARGALRR